ncbi:hypothetical protein U9M48_036145 [Paspalum notatum var. saurae]|uniref:Integrase catalytic domain-containing protein n=1 Tax=Paspalum notatum var. saurae TaxID=547442 RepID=A0AAQ3X865_PASNO
MELRKRILDEAHTSMQQQNLPRPETKILVDSYEMRDRQRNGKMFTWTSLSGCLALRRVMTIWVIIDRLTKSAHFLPVKTHYTVTRYARLYISQIVSLHGVPRTITSHRGSLFVSRFWEQLQAALGTNLVRSSAYHPQTSGQVERVNQILEYMLRACVLTYSTKWDDCLPLAKFAYNNSYQKSLEMAPFEALYGR